MSLVFYIAALVLALLIGWDLAKPLKNYPGVFYVIALVLDALPFAFDALGLRSGFLGSVSALVETGALAFFMFCIVMFTGCFKLGSEPRMKLKQVRQPLALMTCILACGHIAWVAYSWGPKVEALGFFFVSVSALVAILLAILGICSITKVQEILAGAKLTAIQRLSYPFFVFLCIHAAAIYLLHGAWAVGALYMGICFLYIALRLRAR